MLADIRVSTHFVRPLTRALSRAGIDSDRFLSLQRLDGEHPRRVPIELAISAWRAATDATSDAAIGVRAALALAPGDFGVLEYAARSSPSLRAAFERVSRYQRLLNDMAVLEIRDDGPVATLRYLQPGLPPAYLEFVLGSWVAIATHLPEASFRLVAASLTHPAPADPTPQRGLFGEGLVFDAPHAELVVDRACFERRLGRADAGLMAALDRHAEAALDSLARGGEWTRRITDTIEDRLADGAPRLQDVAATLAIEPRALRRKLEAEGQTYSGLLDRTRRRLALEMVEDDSLSLGEIAFLLGFSEPSAFHRAFRRWTGHTPRPG